MKAIPLEPIHVHVAEGSPVPNATKIWITKGSRRLLCNNNSRIPEKTLRNIMRIIESQSQVVIDLWIKYFGEISYYC